MHLAGSSHNSPTKKPGEESTFAAEHKEDVAEIFDEVISYGPPGFKGVFASRFVTYCAAFAALGGFLFGYDQGVISVTLVMREFLDRFPEVSDDAAGSGFKKGLMTAMIPLAAFIGALNMGWLADWISRKRSLMVAVVIFIVGSSIQTAAINYDMLTAGRFFGGVGIGMLSMVVPVYISEISPPEIRGTLLVFEELSIVVGIILAFWITYATKDIPNHWSWQCPFLIQIIPGVLLGIGAIFLPYSPRWLASKDRHEESLATLARLRGLPQEDPSVRREWIDIVAEARFQAMVLKERHPTLTASPAISDKIKLEIVSWTDCFKTGCWRRTHVGVGIQAWQQWVGINALIYYSPTLFATMGLDYNMQLLMSGALNCVQVMGVLSSLWTLDRFGRRNILLLGSVCMCLSHVVIAILVGKFPHDWQSYVTEGWVSVAFLFAFMLSFGFSWGPIPWALPSGVFPSSLRVKGVAISTCGSLITPPLIKGTGVRYLRQYLAACNLTLPASYEALII
ncbi:MFS monosaccharide transporter [Colletotrichum chrysophilum]|uniref:MFS monosaccharide transporter n=1 Tax=Colletotrichum chrysophilum TaxID=1836956 RepID=A0AAD9AU56_9PEZI|nr:MFS monosaccharide transporter [Colletotrichum chrysophilum]